MEHCSLGSKASPNPSTNVISWKWTLARDDQEEEPLDCLGFEDSTLYAEVPFKGTRTPQDLPQVSDAQSICEGIDQWMKWKEEEFAKFMAAHKKSSDRLMELAL